VCGCGGAFMLLFFSSGRLAGWREGAREGFGMSKVEEEEEVEKEEEEEGLSTQTSVATVVSLRTSRTSLALS
jgi:hypothetical protein